MVKEAYNIGQLGVVTAFKCHEGNITMEKTHGVGGNQIKPQCSIPIEQYMKVTLSGDMTVKKATAGDIVIGYAYANPMDWEVEPRTNYTQEQAILANMIRECSIETIFKKIERVTCKNGESIAVGDYIKYGATNIDEFEEADSKTNIIALTAIDSDNEVIVGFI